MRADVAIAAADATSTPIARSVLMYGDSTSPTSASTPPAKNIPQSTRAIHARSDPPSASESASNAR